MGEQSGPASWQNQTIKTNTTISGNQNAGTAAGNTVNPMAIELYNMTPDQRRQIALALKGAGWSVPTNGSYSSKLLDAYQTAQQAAQLDAAQLGQKFDSSYFSNFLTRETAAGAASGAAGRTRKETVISSPTQAAALINAVLKDAVGRQATDAELKKYTAELQKAQRANPVSTQYGAGSYPSYTQEGGLDSQQFLIQRIAGTDEAKANSVFNFYNAFKNAIGVA